jgi:hypothetical protein
LARVDARAAHVAFAACVHRTRAGARADGGSDEKRFFADSASQALAQREQP